ncbi:MAG: hypothetical protein CFH01_00117 [Alphaproteobacteria bacterium MarineAlpha2_Bin1]|nr:MAG: hypothetical protein CFH01_00117 [Alphaproteobacteria bacterium MarineAlpha2_Bin1]
MLYLIFKSLISGIMIGIISEVAKKYPGLGGLIASLPLISVIGIIWLWNDTQNLSKIVEHSYSTLFFVIPSLPFFIVLPICIKTGIPFWIAISSACIVTILLYIVMIKSSSIFGIKV